MAISKEDIKKYSDIAIEAVLIMGLMYVIGVLPVFVGYIAYLLLTKRMGKLKAAAIGVLAGVLAAMIALLIMTA